MARKKTKAKPLTVPELSEATKISERQIARYLARGCPRTSAEDVLTWKARNIRDRNSGGSVVSGTIQEARLELIQRQAEREIEVAEKYAIQNAQRRGELIEKVEVERDLSLGLSRLRNRLSQLGSDIGNLMPSEVKAVTKSKVESTVDIALRELSNSFSQLAAGFDDDGDGESA